MKKQMVVFVAITASMIGTPQAYGWSRVGHQTVALIAERRLSTTTLSKVHSILGPGISLADIAGCADNIKRHPVNCAGSFQVARDPSSKRQHYINVSVADSPNSMTIMGSCRVQGKTQACNIDQIQDGLAVLKDPAATRAQKQIALMFIVHFVGDLHQPLHNASEVDARGRGDGGGNGANVWFMQSAKAKTPTNLHHVWDNVIESDAALKRMGAGTLAEELTAEIQSKDVAAWLKVSVAESALESFLIAKTLIYPAYHAPDGKRPSLDYQARMRPVAREQVAKAGVRLAAMLEEALSP